jgi:hypothetical protein
MKKVELFGSETKSLTPFLSEQRRLNCYYQIIASGEKGVKAAIRGTPGYFQFTSLPTMPIKGFIVVNEVMYVVGGNSLYSVNQGGNVTLLGTMIAADSNYVSMASNGLQIIICNGTNGYIYTLSTTTLSLITSASFPQSTTSVCFLNGFFVVYNPGTGQFFISNVYDGTTWQALQFATAEFIPDDLLAVKAYHGILVLFGQNHLEYWQDTGGSPFPFSSLVGTAQDFGLAAPNSILAFNNSITFLGQNQEGHAQVMTLNGYAPQRISDDNIENIMNGFMTVDDAVALTYMVDGVHSCLMH